MENKPVYSVIIPVYNSESSLFELFSGLKDFFAQSGNRFEVIFVDDASSDRSWERITELQQKHPDVVISIGLAKNFGQHNATLCGISFARGQRMVTIDDDLQTPPQEIGKLITAMDAGEYDLVYGTYRNKQHSATRNLGSKSLKVSAKALHTAKGEGSSFRLLTKELASNLLNHRQNFIFLDEVMLWYTDNVGFAEVLHQPRKYDRSGYTFGKLVRLFANLALYYTMVPLKVLVYGGLAISFITFFYGLFFIFKKLVFDVPLGYTSLIVTILFSTSIILFSLGVLGEYLSRMYQIQNGKPPYAIKKVLKRGEKSSQDKL